MLEKPKKTTASGVKDNTKKIRIGQSKSTTADSKGAKWQMNLAEFNRNGCLINGD